MARPNKPGLDYFPLDCSFFTDPKIRRLHTRFGNAGRELYLYLLCRIYEKGFFIEEDEDLLLDAADVLGVSEDLTSQILTYLVSRSLLTRILGLPVTVLTGTSIQLRFQAAKKAAKQEIEVDERIWLLSPSETAGFIKVIHSESFSEKNPRFSEKNHSKSEKNPTKESKGKKSKVKESNVTPFGVDTRLAKAFDSWLDYKKERKEAYQPSGLQALITRLTTYRDKYGEAAVADLIEECMANGWKGIIFDRLDKGQATPKRALEEWEKNRSYDLDAAVDKAKYTVPTLKKKESKNE